MSSLYYKGARGVVVREEGERLVLVVEDSDTVRKALARLLYSFGYSVDTASDGIEAIEKAETGAYDAILMDLAMPGMDGLQATKHIRDVERKTGLLHTPIVAVTDYPHRNVCLAAGMDECLAKPIIPAQLAQTVLMFTRMKRAS